MTIEKIDIRTFRGEFFDSELERTSYIDGWFSGAHVGCMLMIEHIVEQLKLTPEQKDIFNNDIEDVISSISTK